MIKDEMKGAKMLQQCVTKNDHVRNLIEIERRGSDSLPEVNIETKSNKPIEKYVHPHGRGNGGNTSIQGKGYSHT